MCPIQFVGSPGTKPIFSLDDLHNKLNVTITFKENTAGAQRILHKLFMLMCFIFAPGIHSVFRCFTC